MIARKLLAIGVLSLSGLTRPEVVGAVLGAFAMAIAYKYTRSQSDETRLMTDGGNKTSEDDAEEWDYDHEVVVDSVDEITSVPIECPGCGGQFREKLSDNLGGTTCHECKDWIRYVRRHEIRDRGDSTEDTTEQAKLIPDGGAVEDDTESCDECGSPADLRFAGGFLCPDCYVDEPGVGGHIGTRRETAQASRERLRQLQTDTDHNEGDQR